MKLKKWTAAALALGLLLSLSGCGDKGPAVYVQSVKTLTELGGIGAEDRFAGLVVSENVVEIQRDSDKTVEELLVREGDDVARGQELFRYDVEQIQLTLDKQKLELEQLNATIESLKEQIEQLKKDRDRSWGTQKLQYTVQIQTAEVDLKEAELNVRTKEQEIAKSEELLANTTVVSPVDGRIQAISETGTDEQGNPVPYITIQQSGSYRVKGMLGELQRGGITEGTRLKILSRTDESQVWYGTVTLVDYENPSQGSGYEMYSGMNVDSMTAASRYPFYVELESTQGLILGQHVYMMMDTGEQRDGMALYAGFITVEEDGSAWVWAETGRGRLEKRTVTLGEYDPMTDTYLILEGLTVEDFIAFPDEELCHEGASTTHEETEPTEGGFDEPMGEEFYGEEAMPPEEPMPEGEPEALPGEAAEGGVG